MAFGKRRGSDSNDSGDESIEAQLAPLKSEDDPELRKVHEAEAQSIAKHEQLVAEQHLLEKAVAVAQDAHRSECLRSVKGLTCDIGKTRAALDGARDRCEGGRELIAASADELVQVRERVRQAQERAADRARGEILKLAAANIEKRNARFAELESLTSNALACLDALERVCTSAAVLDAHSRVVGFRLQRFDEAWRVLLGVGDHSGSGLARMQSSFRSNPYADKGGVLGAWRELAADAGLLSEQSLSAEQRERRARERASRRERLADGMVQGALRDGAVRVRLANHWRTGDKQ